MNYLTIKYLHVTCAILSIGLFILRGSLALWGKPWRNIRVLRWLPHAVDTTLLCAAIMLAWMSGQYPFFQPWLTAKLVALVLYILLGKQALKPGVPRARCAVWFGLALCSVGYIVAVARTRSILPGL